MRKPKNIIDFRSREPGCYVALVDDPVHEVHEVPVCMGGTAIVGCTNPSGCLPKINDLQPLPIALVGFSDALMVVPGCAFRCLVAEAVENPNAQVAAEVEKQ